VSERCSNRVSSRKCYVSCWFSCDHHSRLSSFPYGNLYCTAAICPVWQSLLQAAFSTSVPSLETRLSGNRSISRKSCCLHTSKLTYRTLLTRYFSILPLTIKEPIRVRLHTRLSYRPAAIVTIECHILYFLSNKNQIPNV
jgi:hypothetical protein